MWRLVVGAGYQADYSQGARRKLGRQKRFMLFSCRDIVEVPRACGQREMYSGLFVNVDVFMAVLVFGRCINIL